MYSREWKTEYANGTLLQSVQYVSHHVLHHAHSEACDGWNVALIKEETYQCIQMSKDTLFDNQRSTPSTFNDRCTYSDLYMYIHPTAKFATDTQNSWPSCAVAMGWGGYTFFL